MMLVHDIREEAVEACSRHYKDLWTPQVGEMLLFKREPTNPKDSLAVAVMKEAEIVGHVPYNITSLLSNFLRRDCNKRFAEVTGNARWCRIWNGSSLQV